MLSDTIVNESPTDTLFVPLYLYKDTSYAGGDSLSDPGFNDYVVQVLNDAFPALELRPSLFQHKTYSFDPKMRMKPLDKSSGQFDWAFVLLFGLLVLITVFLRLFRYGCAEIVRSCFSTKDFEIMTKSRNALLVPVALLFFPITALFVFSAVKYFEIPIDVGIKLTDLRLFLGAAGCVVAFIGVKMLIVVFFGSLFRNKNLSRYYAINQMAFLFLDSLLLILPVTLSLFVDTDLQYYFIIFSAALLAILSVTRAVRGLILVFNSAKRSQIYLFCYLCIVELLPLLLVAKVLFSN